MRDIKVIVTPDEKLDIDIIEGEPDWLDSDSETEDQRAAIAAYTVKASIPGMKDIGVSWHESRNLGDINTEIVRAINQSASNKNSYVPVYERTSSGALRVRIIRG